MLYQKSHRFVIGVLLLLFLMPALVLIAQDNADVPAVPSSYQTSLTYPDCAGLSQPIATPSYQSSLTYADYAGLKLPTATPSYQSSLTYPDYAGLKVSSLPLKGHLGADCEG